MSESPEQDEGTGARVIRLELVGGPNDFLSFGELIAAFRAWDEANEAKFAEVLGVGEAHLRDVEAGREGVSAEEAAIWASAVGYPATVFVQRVLQDQLDKAELEMTVSVEAA